MVRTGRDYLVGLRDGRHVQLGSEVVSDVTTHPAFRNSVQSVARLYDAVHEEPEKFTYSEAGSKERYNAIWLRPRDAQDLAARRRVHARWAELTYGLIGRSPDHVAGFITGMACDSNIADRHGQGFDKNIVAYWEHVRNKDLYVSYAVAPPGRARAPEINRTQTRTTNDPGKSAALRVVAEDDKGVTVWGTKILATAAVLSDELFVGNLLPLSPGEEKYAATFAVPIAAPGVRLLPRKSYEGAVGNPLDNPLSVRFDETDCVVFFDNVVVPWERVFNHDHIDTALALFIETPAHVLGNAQAHSRLLAKMRLGLGLIHRITDMTGVGNIPAVKEELAGLAVQVAVAEGLIVASDAKPHTWPSGYISPNLQAMYAMIAWSTETVPGFLHSIRMLLGSQPFQQAADGSIFDDPQSSALLVAALGSDSVESARERYKLISLAWDLVGSEFASRHLQYEMFYAGARHVTRARMSHNFDWKQADEVADRSVADFNEWLAGQALSERQPSLPAAPR